jgi:hypothetical protein
MPTSTTPSGTGANVGGFYVSHTNGVQLQVSVQEGSFPVPDVEEAIQDVMNHLNVWPERDTMYPLEAGKTESQTYPITPDPAE